MQKRKNLNMNQNRVPKASDHLRRGTGENGLIQWLGRPQIWRAQTSRRTGGTGHSGEQLIEAEP
jgi:hypothetical protein